MTAKTVNYTPEQTTKMVADYQAGVTVDQIAEALGKSVRSIVAKLSREGVYKRKPTKPRPARPWLKRMNGPITSARHWA